MVITLLCLISLSFIVGVYANSSNYVIFPTNSTLNGIPYSEWISKWWIWNTGIPDDMHPLRHYPDPARCSSMQQGPVWFLPNALSDKGLMNYQCNIPFGKVIMLPISMSDCDTGSEGPKPDSDLKFCGQNINTTSDTIEVTIDGEKVNTTKLGSRPINTDFFNVTYPANPVKEFGEGVKPGTYRAIGQAYILFIHNLPVGKHDIDMRVVDFFNAKPGNKGAGEESKARYEIFVQ